MAPLSPTVARWELTSRLRLRIAEAGLTGEEVARALGFSPSYWSKIDKDRKVLSEEKLLKLMELLHLGSDEREDLLKVRAATTVRGWWSKFPGLFSNEHQRLWGLEYGASELSCYESLLVPGLLQTANYARALIDGDDVFIPKKEVPKRVEARMVRQHRLIGDDPLRLQVVISEAALHQQIGGAAVLHEQLQHLATRIRAHPETLDIRVMPFTSPKGYLIGGAAFYVLEFDRPMLPPLGWHESAAVSGVIDNQELVRDLTVAFEAAQRNSLDQGDSLVLIEETAGRLGQTI
ncbi:Scr1 family TA system antitoxin-like transcriptional regulator [Nocardia brasiliensis]|uniref:Scr1 family TA system antitoxin-like transcriptional regulator n=1 Tax=Nocardia brasiliensis TaxID=37326 RepID=UPI0024562142|nr:Scr1 family TA system antitoxin-like transcriptional regulator [Nocardia brasiliensis]